MSNDPVTDVSVSAPVRPQRLTVRFDRTGDRLEASRRGPAVGLAVALFVWLIVWTAVCVWLTYEAINNPELVSILVAFFFWSGWVGVFCIMLKSFFQREVIVLDSQGVTFVRHAIVPLTSRTVPLAEVQSFDEYSKVTDSESGQREHGIEMRTLGEPVRFFEGLPDQDRRWLQLQFAEQLEELRRVGRVMPATGPIQDPDDLATVVVATTATVVQPPSDCRWQRLDDFDAIRFVERGRWIFSMLGRLLFINAFWNGGISVYVAGLFRGKPGDMPQDVMGWSGFAFMIPFELIGLMMFVALIISLLEPLRRSVWRFGGGEIESATTWLGVGLHHRYPVDRLHRVELRRSSRDKSGLGLRFSFGSSAVESGSNEHSFELAILEKNNTELCTMPDFTEGEARWIADVLLRERSEWFR